MTWIDSIWYLYFEWKNFIWAKNEIDVNPCHFYYKTSWNNLQILPSWFKNPKRFKWSRNLCSENLSYILIYCHKWRYIWIFLGAKVQFDVNKINISQPSLHCIVEHKDGDEHSWPFIIFHYSCIFYNVITTNINRCAPFNKEPELCHSATALTQQHFQSWQNLVKKIPTGWHWLYLTLRNDRICHEKKVERITKAMWCLQFWSVMRAS